MAEFPTVACILNFQFSCVNTMYSFQINYVGFFFCWFTLTADYFDAHARVAIPLHRVELDESCLDGLIEVVVLDGRVVCVSLEDLCFIHKKILNLTKIFVRQKNISLSLLPSDFRICRLCISTGRRPCWMRSWTRRPIPVCQFGPG